jgi:diacylglycerol kinase family enzyme
MDIKNKKVCFIVNCEKEKKFNKFISKNVLDFEFVYEVCSASEVSDIILKNFDLGCNVFVSCGGDGTLNNLINCVMSLDLELRKDILVSVLPIGKANDFATNFNVSVKNFKNLMTFESKSVPIVRVNNKYFITGGCFGFSAKMIDRKINLEKKKFHNFWFNLLGFNVYTVLSVYYLKKFKSLPEFSFDDKSYSDVLMTTVMNQKYIGKKFYFAHKKNSDDYFEVRNISDESSYSKRIRLMDSVMKKDYDYICSRFSDVKFSFPDDVIFMGDGEILVSGCEFNFELVSDLKFLVNT